MAKEAIERILTCDENARATVDKARREAEHLLTGVEKRLEILRQEAQKKIDEFKQEEISKILEQASLQASEIEKEAEDYCQRLKRLWGAHKKEVLSEFMERFYREAGLF